MAGLAHEKVEEESKLREDRTKIELARGLHRLVVPLKFYET